MEFFQHAKTIRLKTSHGKYLTAEEDEESVTQDRNGSSNAAKWTVEFVGNSDTNVIRLKSCYGKYLTASNQPFLPGATGWKVLQTLPQRLGSSVEWEPVKKNGAVHLKTRYGQFLIRANAKLPPPWRNSVTHNIPRRKSSQERLLWEVHVLEILVAQSPMAETAPPRPLEMVEEDYVSSQSVSFSRLKSNDSLVSSPPKGSDGRRIYFHVADENGQFDDGFEELSITFEGNVLNELKRRLEDKLGIYGITVCARSTLNGKLYPLRLQLPPNNVDMHVVVVPPSFQDEDSE